MASSRVAAAAARLPDRKRAAARRRATDRLGERRHGDCRLARLYQARAPGQRHLACSRSILATAPARRLLDGGALCLEGTHLILQDGDESLGLQHVEVAFGGVQPACCRCAPGERFARQPVSARCRRACRPPR